MELNKIYAFRAKNEDKLNTHTRLVVGHIWKDDVDDDDEKRDFQAYYFDMQFIAKRPTDAIWGGRCITTSNEWQCREGNVFNFAGEVGMGLDVEYFEDVLEVVGDEAQALITKHNCYNLAWNNCNIFARRLAKRIEKKPDQVPQPQDIDFEPFDMRVERFEID
ncbi:MAG: hypothetical protein Q9213_005445 [Squamulea squamosa]